jgi:hypothetical protein
MPYNGELIFAVVIVNVPMARFRLFACGGDSRVGIFFMAVVLLFVQYDARAAQKFP